MKLERRKNASRNVIFGVLLKLYQIILPFIMRTVMVYSLGVEYLGLNSLFTSVLQVLNLAELGVGSAMVFSMYRPIVEDDDITICALMKLYRLYYRVIGGIVLAAGLLLMPFLPNLIEGDVPGDINIYWLFLLNLAATVFTYWLFAYRNSILQAYQRNDVVSKVTIATDTLKYGLQLCAIILLKNYYYYVIAILLSQIIANILTAVASRKMYPQYSPRGKLPKSMVKEINNRIKDLFTSKLGGTIVISADTIVVSAFLGLTVLAVYQNYYFILTAIIGVVAILFKACMAGIGNSLIVETREKNYSDFKKFTFITAWVAGFCTSCLLCLYQPFMRIWVGEELLLEYSAVICFCVYFFIYEINQLLNTYKDAGGIWHEDRFRPLVTGLANLGLNLVMVQHWGIYGVLLSTVISMLLVGMPWILYNLFTTLFERHRLADYLKHLLFYTVVSAVACAVNGIICSWIVLDDWATLILRGIICVIVPNAVFLLVYRKRPEFAQTVALADKMTGGKLKLARRLKLKG